MSVQYLTTAPEGELVFEARPLRVGGSSDVVRVELAGADGQPVLTSTVTLAKPRPGGTRYDAVPMPTTPPPEQCRVVTPPVELVPFAQHVEIRAVAVGPLVGGEKAELLAWLRWADPEQPVDAGAVVVFLDALAPALYGIATVPVPVPTVDFTVTLSPGPEEGVRTGWVVVRIATRTARDGWCVDDSDVWDADGRLLGQARQTRRVLGEVRPEA